MDREGAGLLGDGGHHWEPDMMLASWGSSMGELKPGQTASQKLGEKAGIRAVSKGHVLSLSLLPIN